MKTSWKVRARSDALANTNRLFLLMSASLNFVSPILTSRRIATQNLCSWEALTLVDLVAKIQSKNCNLHLSWCTCHIISSISMSHISIVGDWFCSAKCQEIHHRLRNRVNLGPIDLDEDYQWQLLHGKDGTTSTTWQLKGCQDILEESFDPIIDQISKQNLVKGMVYSEQQGEWDHSGMFAAVLKYKVGFLTGQRKLAWLAAKQETRMQNILMMRNARRKRIEGHLEQQLAGEKDTLSKKSLSSKGFAIPKVCDWLNEEIGSAREQFQWLKLPEISWFDF